MYSFPRLSSIRLTLVLDTDEVDFDTPPNHTPNVSAYGLDRLSMAICGKRTLEKVSIYVQNTWQEQEDTLTPVLYARQLVAGEAFRALEGLRNLKHLSVGEIPVYLQPEDITSMARAWPQLEHLLFTRASPDIVFPVEITIEDLYPLAEHCPNLEFLAIPVAGSGNTSVPFDGVIPERLVQRPLASIDLRHSDIQSGPDCERIARFLSMVYPNTGFTLWPENKEVVHEVIDLLWELRGY
ncbi:hypothetical protein PsYK624_112320 [Phanerochaete sordida]|uniref:Uncharacterized protein n=1 Tax=Phanerochaete sordida TaxID=48140 RepID=A0A9P3LHJ9_9APHY|nr:hypothetical protein PsYK624_112320 [Phanerochaete sordida]